jgi:DNA-binding transcriptional LysR family regulator
MSLSPVRAAQQESRINPAAQPLTALLYLYYPARRQASPALRALIDYLLQMRRAR